MRLHRNYAKLAERYLKNFPVLCLIGPRQAGKTFFSKQLRPNWRYFDLERPSDYELIANSPELFFEQYPQNIIIDEAQEQPQLFKILRSVIDENRSLKGRFIVTGSSSPEITAHLSDSLAGRVGIIQMGGLKANEFYQTELSSFYNLFTDKDYKNNIQLEKPLLTNAQVRHCWLYGGYPEPLLANDLIQYQDWMHNYYATYINRDVLQLFPKLNKIAYQRFIGTLSTLSGTIINKADLARSIEIGEKTISEYLNIAEQTFLWRNIPYDSDSTVKSLVKRPKGYLTDTGLLHYLMKIIDHEQLLRHPCSGRSFESFIIEEIIKGVTAKGISNVDFQYYRTAKGAEVDLVVKTPMAHIPIEIKMAKSVTRKQLIALNKYIEDHQLPFGLVINQCDDIFWLTDKILQIPISMI
jgi:predicted AAA+ superfamily ATPase